MKTEIYEADPFTGRKGKLMATFNTDYRFERQDEIVLGGAEKAVKVRVVSVLIRFAGGELEREMLAMRV